MGYMRAHAVVVTGSREEDVIAAHQKAGNLFPDVAPVTPITPAAVNGSRSFMVAPDGSKEGWTESNIGDQRRKDFIAWLRHMQRSGTLSLNWVEVQFGDDEGETKICDHSESSDHTSHHADTQGE